jgi:hypothetical protein
MDKPYCSVPAKWKFLRLPQCKYCKPETAFKKKKEVKIVGDCVRLIFIFVRLLSLLITKEV